MITSERELESLVARASDVGHVAVDTEFVWERTYYPRLGVVQLGFSEDACYLVDAAALDLAPLGPLLADPGIVKILHDAQQDLTILRRATGAAPRNVFDTRLAAGFVGLGATLSLGNLLQTALGVHLPKTQTRTDWLRRPLSERQLDYALDDVRYLPALRVFLLERIDALDRAAWLQEELAAYDDPSLYDDRDPEAQFERLSGTGRLNPRQRAVLRVLAAWREHEARRRDCPRGHVMDDKTLGALARSQPSTPGDLAGTRGLSDRARRRYGRALLEAVEEGLAAPPEPGSPRPTHGMDGDVLKARVNVALAGLTGKGIAEAIDPGLVATRADVEALVTDGPAADPGDHALLRGWRRRFYGDDLLALLTGDRALRLDPDNGLPQLVNGRHEAGAS